MLYTLNLSNEVYQLYLNTIEKKSPSCVHPAKYPYQGTSQEWSHLQTSKQAHMPGEYHWGILMLYGREESYS